MFPYYDTRFSDNCIKINLFVGVRLFSLFICFEYYIEVAQNHVLFARFALRVQQLIQPI